MSWHVQYRKEALDCVDRYDHPGRAIDAACALIDEGAEVYGLGEGPLTDTIDPPQIAKIYDLWVRTKSVSR